MEGLTTLSIGQERALRGLIQVNHFLDMCSARAMSEEQRSCAQCEPKKDLHVNGIS